MSNRADALQQALAYHQQGRLAEAEGIYREILARNPQHPDCLHLLGVISRQRGRPDTAIDLISRALALAPDLADAHGNLGNALLDLGRLPEAVTSLERATRLKPGEVRHHVNLANALTVQGAWAAAAASYRRAADLAPSDAAVHRALGNVLRELGRYREAAQCFETAIALEPGDAATHIDLGNVRKEQGRSDDAEACYKQAAALNPRSAVAHFNLGQIFKDRGLTEDACEHYRRALAINPNNGMAKIAQCMAQLRVVYRSADEIDTCRTAYADALDRLRTDLATPEGQRDLVAGLGSAQPFFLPYQGRNDRELQSRYGSLVATVMAKRFPPAPVAPRPAPDEPIRVGIVSGYYWFHSNWKIPIKGWLSQLDRRRFVLYGYYTGKIRDEATRLAESLCYRFVQGPLPLARWREEILADAPHVLIYPEVGMDPTVSQLAAQRLAQVQCNSWGHPETSGLPTLDYYLSSALMELPEAQEHYTETLIRLPNLSIYYEPVEVEPDKLTRAELGLRPDVPAFWCCQALFKYLPQFDQVFPRIARAAGDCQFVFLETVKGRYITDLFLQRLDRAFADAGLDRRRHCVVLPYLSRPRFFGAMACCDVFLDSIGWSGCNSTLESLAANLPIVTFRGTLMRGRHSAAILDMMGVSETIARGTEDYIAIAARLAREPDFRAAMARRIDAGKQKLYRDRECITALEDFLERVVRRTSLD